MQIWLFLLAWTFHWIFLWLQDKARSHPWNRICVFVSHILLISQITLTCSSRYLLCRSVDNCKYSVGIFSSNPLCFKMSLCFNSVFLYDELIYSSELSSLLFPMKSISSLIFSIWSLPPRCSYNLLSNVSSLIWTLSKIQAGVTHF